MKFFAITSILILASAVYGQTTTTTAAAARHGWNRPEGFGFAAQFKDRHNDKNRFGCVSLLLI